MDSKQHIYYALGTLAYAVAKADGKVQNEERLKVKEIVKKGIEHEVDFTYTDIIFQILQKDNMGFKDVYKWAMKSFETGKYHLTPEVKIQFIQILDEVAASFTPDDPEEQKLLSNFKEDLQKLATRTAHD